MKEKLASTWGDLLRIGSKIYETESHRLDEEEREIKIQGIKSFRFCLMDRGMAIWNSRGMFEPPRTHIASCQLHLKYCGPMFFKLYMETFIECGKSDKAIWGTRVTDERYSPFDVLSHFVDEPDIHTRHFPYKLKSCQRRMRHFVLYLKKVEIALVKLAVHPERDLFLQHWGGYYAKRFRGNGIDEWAMKEYLKPWRQ